MTAENLVKTYDTSIVVRRWLGAWVDFAVLLAIFLIPDLISHDLYVRGLPLWVVLAGLYFPVLETLFGRTVGKFAARTIVVTSEGNRPGVWQAIVRTLFRLIEVNPFLAGGVPAGIVAAISKTRQRMGDYVAGTYVLKAEDAPLLSEFLTYVPAERLASKRRSRWALAAGYLGLCSVLLVPGPFAVAAGILGLKQLGREPHLGGKAGAIFGIVAGSIATVTLIAVGIASLRGAA